MGAKSFFEKCFGVEFGPHSFKSGIPKVLVPGCVLMFLAVFFLVVGVLLCGVHAAYEVSRVDDTYEDYFLISGIIAVVLGFILALVGIGWCCHVKSHMQDEMMYYHDTKLARSASIRSGIDASELTSVSRGSFRSVEQISHNRGTGQYPSQYHQEVPYDRRSDRSFDPNADNWGSVSTYQDPNEVRLPQRQQSQPYRSDDAATRISNKLNRGVKDLQNFVNRNTGKSSNKVPYSERMSTGGGGMMGDRNGIDPDHPVDEDGNFDLSRTYKAPKPQYHGQRSNNNRGYPSGTDPVGEFGEDGGYANVRENKHESLPGHGRTNPNSEGQKGRNRKSRGQNEAVPAEIHPEPQIEMKSNPESYRYHQGRPLDSSIDSEAETTTLMYNPKDGRWYYYYKGRPVSEYTGNNPERDAKSGPKYRYVNGKPVLVTKSTENLDRPQGTQSTEI